MPNPVASSTSTDSEAFFRKLLPKIDRFAVRSEEYGLVTTPNTRRLPPEAPQDRPGHPDYTRPRLLQDSNLYLAYYPRLAINRGEIFGCLDVTKETLPNKILPFTNGGKTLYSLEHGLKQKWVDLETRLQAVIMHLWRTLPERSTLGEIDPPRFPETFGYRRYHRSIGVAISCIVHSRDAFTMMGAMLTFMLSLSFTPYEHDCFEPSFKRLLADQALLGINGKWLASLKESYVCALGFGLRAGAMVDAHRFGWAAFIPKFVAAGVPLWFIWGHDERMPDVFLIRNKHFKQWFFPPAEIIGRADRKAANPVVPLYEPPKVLRSHYDLSVSVDEDDFLDEAHNNTSEYASAPGPSLPAIPYGTVPKNSLQRPGEHYNDFFCRMDRRREECIARETASERQRREDMERLASEYVYSKQTAVFLWEEQDGFWRRTSLTKAEVHIHWDDYTPNQRRYLGHLRQWDLCPMFPLSQDGKPPPRPAPQFIDSDDELDYEDLPYPDDTWQPPEGAVHGAVENAEAGNDVDDEGAAEHSGATEFAPPPQTIEALLDALSSRFGYTCVNPQRPELYSTDPELRTDDATVVLRGLSFSKLRNLRPDSAQILLDFYNTLVNSRLNLHDFPPSWDINPMITSKISLQRPGFTLSVLQYQNRHLYIILGGSIPTDWVVALTDPTIVLLAYRKASLWSSLHDLVRLLLRLRVPFQMPRITYRAELGKSVNHSHSYGLGYREYGWKPKDLDIAEYELRRKAVLESPLGRAFRLEGGFVGRLAEEFVSVENVLNGPVYMNKVIAECDDGSGRVFAEDDISLQDQHVVCGVYFVTLDSPEKTVSTMSWWPTFNRWENCGFDLGQWLPDTEDKFRFRQQKLRAVGGSTELLAGVQWKSRTRHFISKSNSILKPARDLAERFILHWVAPDELGPIPLHSNKRPRVDRP